MITILAINAVCFVLFIFIGIKTRTYKWALLIYACFFCLSALNVVYYAHFLDQSAWYYEYRSWLIADYIPSLSGLLIGALTTIKHRSFRLGSVSLTLIMAAIIICGPWAKLLINPLDESIITDKWNADVCLQSTPSTCGPAALATLLKARGLEYSELTIAQNAYSSGTGTELWYLARFARSIGIDAHFVEDKNNVPAPAIIGVYNGAFGHFLSVLRVDNYHIEFGDSLSGKRNATMSDFKNNFGYTGLALVVAPAQ